MPPPHKQKKHTKALWISIGVMLALIVIIAAAASQSSNGSSSTSTNTTSQIATTEPTQPATAMATRSIGIAEDTAVLGGSIFAFDNKLGANNCCNKNGWDINTMWVGVYTAENGGSWLGFDEQSHKRVVGIYINPYNTDINQTGTPVWNNIQTAKQICNVYLPPDARLQKTQGGWNEYYSPLLAKTLPSSDFTDINNHPEKPGLFFVVFDTLSSSSPQIDYCVLATDRSLQRENLALPS